MEQYVPTLPSITEEILSQLITKKRPKIEQIDYLLKAKNHAFEDQILMDEAERQTVENVGPLVHVRAIIEFSNVCELDCHYCGIRKSHDASRFNLSSNEILEVADRAIALGYPGILLQSGELKSQAHVDFVASVAKEIHKHAAAAGRRLRLIGSIGELTYAEYNQLRQAGFDRYLLRIETSNQQLFEEIHPIAQRFESRDACLGYLKDIGFAVGSGTLIGVPNQTTADLARDLLYFRDKGIDMIGMGPYLPAIGTPMAENYKRKTVESELHTESLFDTVLRMIAVGRILIPKANISATTAMEALSNNARISAIRAGANVIMPVMTPAESKAKYALYQGKSAVNSSLSHLREEAREVGREIDLDELGDPLSWTSRAK